MRACKVSSLVLAAVAPYAWACGRRPDLLWMQFAIAITTLLVHQPEKPSACARRTDMLFAAAALAQHLAAAWRARAGGPFLAYALVPPLYAAEMTLLKNRPRAQDRLHAGIHALLASATLELVSKY